VNGIGGLIQSVGNGITGLVEGAVHGIEAALHGALASLEAVLPFPWTLVALVVVVGAVGWLVAKR
jgi:hypothetical protein